MNRSLRPKILIIGDGGHGKDTLSQIWFKYFSMTYKSSSVMALELFMLDQLADHFDLHTVEEVEKTKAIQDQAKDNTLRKFMYDAITDYNTPDRTRLAKEILKHANAYNGMRNLEELRPCIDNGLFDWIIGVDASIRLPSEDSSSTSINILEWADMIIPNNGTKAHFKTRAWKIGALIFNAWNT